MVVKADIYLDFLTLWIDIFKVSAKSFNSSRKFFIKLKICYYLFRLRTKR